MAASLGAVRGNALRPRPFPPDFHPAEPGLARRRREHAVRVRRQLRRIVAWPL